MRPVSVLACDLAPADPVGEREQATGRLLDYYLHTAFAAERRINPGARHPGEAGTNRP